jgi:sulfur carrier protein
MELTINQQKKSYDKVILSVQDLLDIELPHQQKGIALAINDIVVPKNNWGDTLISESDNILIITATQGG